MFRRVVWREAKGPVLVLTGLGLGALSAGLGWWSAAPLALALATIIFLRDPERFPPADPDAVLSPADGRVLSVDLVEEPRFLRGSARRISIFLSVTDVHVNRAPASGRVAYHVYVRGGFRAAYGAGVGESNERNYIGLETDRGRMLVVQIAGAVARRIVWWVKPGDQVAAGARIGLIRFGSCTQLFLPPHAEVVVAPGQRVRGGETVVARLPAVSG